ncbi:hypothetical protein BJ912DRAFT_93930 [Pholiota molesta]|nr:hypothetical protein BJ912DRAFT_93930 [Pholiota molesta]
MGYINFDARKKAEMRSRIEHAIQTLAEWTHYVGSGATPPGRGSGSGGELGGASRHSGERERDRDRGRARERDRDRDAEPPLSAHDAMGGGGAVVGGQFASQHGWKYSFGPSPAGGQAQAPLAPGGAFPLPPPVGGGAPVAAGLSILPPPPPPKKNVPPGQLHVSQWGSGSGMGAERGKSKSRSKSKSRNASRVASRNHSPQPPQEIFIPPNIASDSEDDEDDDEYGAFYDRGQVQQRAYEQPGQSAWVHLNPNPNHAAPVAIPPPRSHMSNPNPNPATQTAVAPWGAQTHAGGSRGDSYAMRNLDQAIGAAPYGPIYSSPQDYAANHLPGFPNRAPANGFQPVIPVIPPDARVLLRKKKEKQRKLERQRARGSKWGYASGTDSEESEGDSDVDEHDKENRIRERGQRNDPLGKKLAQTGPWHQIYAPVPGGRSNPGAQSQIPGAQQQQQQLQQQQQQQQFLHPQDPSRQYMPSYASAQDPTSSSFLTAGRKSRPGSRNPSPNPDTKRRPAPLDLTPPAPVIPALPPQMQGPDGGPVIPPPTFADPALLAQYQFEQQKQDYQRERDQRHSICIRIILSIASLQGSRRLEFQTTAHYSIHPPRMLVGIIPASPARLFSAPCSYHQKTKCGNLNIQRMLALIS